MAPFDQFTELYRSYRWAGEYTGHLDHKLGEVAAGLLNRQGRRLPSSVRKAMQKPKLHDAILPVLRKQLRDPARDQVTIRKMMTESLRDADSYRLTSGQRTKPLRCPWCAKSSSGPSINEATRDRRRDFRNGDDARRGFLEFIDLRSNMKPTVREYLYVHGYIDGLMDEAVRRMLDEHVDMLLSQPDFDNACYAQATFDAIDKACHDLREAHGDLTSIKMSDIEKRIWESVGRNKGITWRGRFGSIGNGILERFYGRAPDVNRDNVILVDPGEMDQQPGAPPQEPWEELLEEVKACIDSYPNSADWDALSLIVSAMLTDGADIDEAIDRAAESTGLSVDRLRSLFRDFSRRLREGDAP